MRKIVKIEIEKARMVETKGRGEKRRSRKEKGRKGGKMKRVEKRKDNRCNKGSRRVRDLG